MRDRGQEYYDLTLAHPELGAKAICSKYGLELPQFLEVLCLFCKTKGVPMIGLDNPKPPAPPKPTKPQKSKKVANPKMSESLTQHHRDVDNLHRQVASLHFFLKREGLFDKYQRQQAELAKQKALYG